MSLLLTGGGCSTSLGGLVRHTGRAAALIRMPVIPEMQKERRLVRGQTELPLGFPVTFPQSSQLMSLCSYRPVQGEPDWIH